MIFTFGEFTALFSAFLWGNSGVLLKSLPAKTRLSFIFLESLISGSVILSLLFIFNEWSDFNDFTPYTIIGGVLASIINLCGSICYIFTIKHVKVGMAFVVINSLFPLFSIIGSIIFLKESLSLTIYLGALLILAGIAIITLQKGKKISFLEEGSSFKIALIFCVITPLCWATGALFMDRLLETQGVLPMTLIRAATTFTICLALTIFIKKVDFLGIFGSTEKRKKLIFASFLTTGAMLGWFTSLSLSEASLTIILGSSAPIFAVIGARVFLKEKFDRKGIFGIITCGLGVLVVIV